MATIDDEKFEPFYKLLELVDSDAPLPTKGVIDEALMGIESSDCNEFKQEHVHEFLRRLLDRIHADAVASGTVNHSMVQYAFTIWSKFFNSSRSIFTMVYYDTWKYLSVSRLIFFLRKGLEDMDRIPPSLATKATFINYIVEYFVNLKRPGDWTLQKDTKIRSSIFRQINRMYPDMILYLTRFLKTNSYSRRSTLSMIATLYEFKPYPVPELIKAETVSMLVASLDELQPGPFQAMSPYALQKDVLRVVWTETPTFDVLMKIFKRREGDEHAYSLVDFAETLISSTFAERPDFDRVNKLGIIPILAEAVGAKNPWRNGRIHSVLSILLSAPATDDDAIRAKAAMIDSIIDTGIVDKAIAQVVEHSRRDCVGILAPLLRDIASTNEAKIARPIVVGEAPWKLIQSSISKESWDLFELMKIVAKTTDEETAYAHA